MTIVYLHLFAAIVCAPLYQEQIKMNRFYGFRINKAYESRKKWFAINRYGGRLYTYGGALMAVVCYILLEMKHVLPNFEPFWLQFTVVYYFVCIIPIYRYSQKL